MIYSCEKCGRWQDVSLTKAFSDIFANVARSFNMQQPEEIGYPCPAGHGLMRVLQFEDRIFVRPATVDAEQEMQEIERAE